MSSLPVPQPGTARPLIRPTFRIVFLVLLTLCVGGRIGAAATTDTASVSVSNVVTRAAASTDKRQFAQADIRQQMRLLERERRRLEQMRRELEDMRREQELRALELRREQPLRQRQPQRQTRVPTNRESYQRQRYQRQIHQRQRRQEQNYQRQQFRSQQFRRQ